MTTPQRVPDVPAGPAVLTVMLILCTPLLAQRPAADYDHLGRDILKELIETDTTHSSGSTTIAAERMGSRLRTAGFPAGDVQILTGADRHGNLVARYRGTGARKPILFLAHLDVVEARREDWSMDPFALTERDGFFYGRGTLDVKGGAATLVAAFMRLRQEGFVPDLDLVLALTADEEGGTDNGVQWLLTNHRDLFDNDYCINVDAGGPEWRNGKVVAIDVEAAEKVYQSFTLTAKHPGGHSSLPTRDNAIYRLAAALQRLAAFEFPARTNDVTRAYFAAMAPLASRPEQTTDMRAVSTEPLNTAAATRLSAASAFYNALLRTTCVATMLQGGHAENALPQTAQATVNCRMLPDDKPGAVQQTLQRVVADPQIEIASLGPPTPSPPSPLAPDVFKAIETVSRQVWGDIPVVPFMDTGATDGLYLRNAGIPVYGVAPIPYDVDDVRSHGKDERIMVRSYSDGLEFAYRLIARLGKGQL